MNHVRLYAQIVQHLVYGCRHGRRTTEVVLNIFGGIVLAKVLIKYDLVNKN